MKEKMDDVLLHAGDKMVDAANKSGNFLNICVNVVDNKVECELTSWEFPAMDLIVAMATIAEVLSEEWKKANKPAQEPLPVAESLKHLIEKKAMASETPEEVLEGANEADRQGA